MAKVKSIKAVADEKAKQKKIDDAKRAAAIGEDNYKPRRNWVVLKLTNKKAKSIIIGAEDSKEPEDLQKTVVAVGPDVKDLKPEMIVELPNRAIVQILPKLDGLSEYATVLDTEIIGIYK